MFSKNKGFTLIELLIVITILALIASITVIAINPADIFKRTRDSQRISDLDSIRTAINFYIVNTFSSNLGDPTKTYSHIANVSCLSRQSIATTSQLVNGTGWIPVNLLSLGITPPLSKWPVDPSPTTATGDPSYYYVYLTNSTSSTFEITANMESDQYSNGGSNDVESKDGGKIPDLYEIGTEFILTNADTNCYPWYCGGPITFTYKGSQVTYGTVSHNGECWMDRNLGASRVATAYNDSQAYGDLFQWGRLDDGHQNRTSGTTGTLSSSDNPGHSNFIVAPNSPYDWRSPQNNNLWQGVNGINNPCPAGWRIPTSDEWNTERLSWSSQNSAGAYGSPLKLTVGGYRSYTNGPPSNVGNYGYYWSATVSSVKAIGLNFGSSSAGMPSNSRATGCSVRCLKD